MADNTQGTTTAVSFFSCNPEQTNLFSVRPGIPALNALQMASSFLDVARDAAYQGAESSNDNSGYAAGHLVTMAKSVVDSVVRSIEFPSGGEDRRIDSVLERLVCLVRDGTLVIHPKADALAADDAQKFLDWALSQTKGGAV